MLGYRLITEAPSAALAVESDAKAVEAGSLQKRCATLLVPPPSHTKAIVVCLHGFTAGTWQFSDIITALAQDNCCVYAPRLPGHGFLSAQHQHNPQYLPYAHEERLYHEFAIDLWSHIQTLQQQSRPHTPVFLLGFSLGGTLALDLAGMMGPYCQGVILMAPLLLPNGWGRQLLSRSLSHLANKTLRSQLDRLPMSWKTKKTKTQPSIYERPGHWHFKVGQLFAALHFAYRQYKTRLQNPLHPEINLSMLLSDADESVASAPALRLFQQYRRSSHLHHFSKQEGVQHDHFSAHIPRSRISRTWLIEHIKQWINMRSYSQMQAD
jgi:alpha-beta hydrolase superfamily lysophospholipase